jgi:hypothetical protein
MPVDRSVRLFAEKGQSGQRRKPVRGKENRFRGLSVKVKYNDFETKALASETTCGIWSNDFCSFLTFFVDLDYMRKKG